jgi:hypothetical protein
MAMDLLTLSLWKFGNMAFGIMTVKLFLFGLLELAQVPFQEKGKFIKTDTEAVVGICHSSFKNFKVSSKILVLNFRILGGTLLFKATPA